FEDGWSLWFLHDGMWAKPHDNVWRVDIDRALFYASIATGARPNFFACDVVVEQGFPIIAKSLMLVNVFAHLFQTIPCVHNDFAWRQQFSGDIGRACRSTAPAFGTGIRIQKIFPRQVKHILDTEALNLSCGGRDAGIKHG